jgi:hypothetical protein
MPNNMNQSNKGQNMPNKSGQGGSQEDMNRGASDRNQNMGYGKDTGMGQQNSISKSSQPTPRSGSQDSQR